MKILLVKDYNPFYENGASANRFAGLIKGLIARGVEIDLVITKGWTSKLERRQKGCKTNLPGLRFIYASRTMNDNIWKRRINGYLLERIWNAKVQRTLKKLLQGDYDYIWLINEMKCLQAFKENIDKIKAKSFIELNEFNDIYKGAGATGNWAQKRNAIKKDELFKHCIGHIDCFAVMTCTLIDHYKKMAKPDAEFIHLPMTVDFSRFQDVVSSEKYKKPYIAYTGTFNNAKDGIDILIESFARVAPKYPQIHLYLAGFYHYDVPAQKRRIAELKLEDRITYLGVLESGQVPEFISNAQLTVLSRPDSHQAQGGFPTKLGEYLASGNPVCVTSVGEIPDYLKDNESAFLAKPGDIDSFTDAMDRALRDIQNARRLGQNGRRVALEHFNADTQSENLYRFLKKNIGLEIQ